MTKRTRKIILVGLVLFFALVTPTVLLYAWGYTIDLEERKPVLTAGLYASSIPKGAQIYLDDETKGRTPAFIKRLLPKTYQVKISKEGFQVWQKRLRIESGLVAEAKNILLIPLNPGLELVRSDLTEEFDLKEFLSEEKTEEVFYVQEPAGILYKKNPDGSEEQISLSPLPQDHQYEIFVSDSREIALLDETGRLYLLNRETRTFEPIAQNVLKVRFSKDKKKLLYFSPSEIWVYYLDSGGSQECITRLSQEIKDAAWYHETGEHIIFAAQGMLKIIELDSREQRNIFDIIKLKDISEIDCDPADGYIYIVKSNELFKLDITPD